MRGVTLVELVISIVLAGLLVTSMWNAWAFLQRHSVNPMVARQALVAAQALLGEIGQQPLPEGPLGTPTTLRITCEATAPVVARTAFASLSDYNGLVMDCITDATGTPVAGLAGYGASVAVTDAPIQGVAGFTTVVTLSGPGGHTLKLASWRARR